MNSGYYAACAGLIARSEALELAANNLANANTTAYKAQREFFRSIVAGGSTAALNSLNRAINNFGVLGGAAVDFQPGNLERTNGDFDFAIEGLGFFVVQTPAGTQFTRNGNFHLDTSGQLVTSDGSAVLGANGPVRIPPGPVSVSADGSISVKGALVGRLKVVEFQPGTQLTAAGNTRFSAPQGSEIPATRSVIRQGMLEASNLNPISAAVDLVALQRHAEMLQKALSIFHSDFNRAAVQDLPRV